MMTEGSSNPYYDLAAVRHPKMFYGRTRLLRTLYSAIANRQCISLVGPRSIGKSSLLNYMRLEAVQKQFGYDLHQHIFVLIDLREYLHITSEDFFDVVSEHIIAQCEGRLELEQTDEKGVDEFRSIMDQITEQGFHITLLMDAFDNITRNDKFDPEFFSYLRAWATAGRVSYVTASIAPLYEVCHRGIQDSPFFNIFVTRKLEALSLEEALNLVTVPSKEAGCPFTETEAQWVISLAGRHPYFIQ